MAALYTSHSRSWIGTHNTSSHSDVSSACGVGEAVLVERMFFQIWHSGKFLGEGGEWALKTSRVQDVSHISLLGLLYYQSATPDEKEWLLSLHCSPEDEMPLLHQQRLSRTLDIACASSFIHLDRALASKVIRTISCNGMGVQVEGQDRSTGLYLLSSRINHSCAPNCISHHRADRTIVYRALRNIDAGEELTAMYYQAGLFRPAQVRRSHLSEYFLFECDCVRCTRPRERLFRCPTCVKGVIDLSSPPFSSASTSSAIATAAVFSSGASSFVSTSSSVPLSSSHLVASTQSDISIITVPSTSVTPFTSQVDNSTFTHTPSSASVTTSSSHAICSLPYETCSHCSSLVSPQTKFSNSTIKDLLELEEEGSSKLEELEYHPSERPTLAYGRELLTLYHSLCIDSINPTTAGPLDEATGVQNDSLLEGQNFSVGVSWFSSGHWLLLRIHELLADYCRDRRRFDLAVPFLMNAIQGQDEMYPGVLLAKANQRALLGNILISTDTALPSLDSSAVQRSLGVLMLKEALRILVVVYGQDHVRSRCLAHQLGLPIYCQNDSCWQQVRCLIHEAAAG